MTYETVRIVKGHAILRMVGTRGFYHVIISEGNNWRAERTFRTIKAAVEFIETAL